MLLNRVPRFQQAARRHLGLVCVAVVRLLQSSKYHEMYQIRTSHLEPPPGLPAFALYRQGGMERRFWGSSQSFGAEEDDSFKLHRLDQAVYNFQTSQAGHQTPTRADSWKPEWQWWLHIRGMSQICWVFRHLSECCFVANPGAWNQQFISYHISSTLELSPYFLCYARIIIHVPTVSLPNCPVTSD